VKGRPDADCRKGGGGDATHDERTQGKTKKGNTTGVEGGKNLEPREGR